MLTLPSLSYRFIRLAGGTITVVLSLFLGNRIDPLTPAAAGEPNKSFIDVTEAMGLKGMSGGPAAWGDFDNDGLHFGLGKHKDPVRLEIRWTDGARQELESSVDRTITLSAPEPESADEKNAPGLVFSVKTWVGEYSTKDIPGGVHSTPVVGAIYTINADASGLTKIAQLGKNTDYPMFSPDGKWVYFQSNATGRSQVYRSRPDGSGFVNLTAGEKLGKQWSEAYGYALSRDGSQLLYTVHDGSSGRVVLAKPDGAQPRLLFPKLGYTYMGALSPNGDRVVVSGPARGYRLMIANLPDGEPNDLTPDHPESFAPQFTPDGKAIVFVRRDGDVYRVDADGKNLRRLTEGNRYVEFKLSPKDHHGSTDGPHISPDGKRIAYIAIKDGVPNVCVMNIDGKEQRQVTSRKTACGRVRWSPDSKQIAFVSFEGRYPQLFTVVSASGSEARQLTRLNGAVYFVNWKP